MSDALDADLLTEHEYVALELGSAERHEFVDGVARAMSGAALRHNEISGNLYIALRALAAGTGCRVHMESARLRINSRRHYYPDVMASCESPADTHALNAPCLVAEVLSPTTATIDRGEKRLAYLQLPSLRHFLLLDPETEIVEHIFRIDESDPWRFEQLSPGDVLRVRCPTAGAIDIIAVFAEMGT